MTRSTERMLTTFVGSLARPPDLLALMKTKESGQPYDHEALAAQVRSAVAEGARLASAQLCGEETTATAGTSS